MIDIITAIHEKDKEVIDLSIDSIKKHCKDIGKIYAVSKEKYTDKAIWIDEKKFPFSIKDIEERIEIKSQAGWYWQQIMQFYLFDALKLSTNILFINCDVVLMKDLQLMDGQKTVHNYNLNKHDPYLKFNKKMIGENRYQDKFGTCHYMVYNKTIMKKLIKEVETKYNKDFWKAFCDCITQEHPNGSSEFELYFSYLLKKFADKIILKKLKYEDKGDVWNINRYQAEGYDYIGFHSYMRDAAR